MTLARTTLLCLLSGTLFIHPARAETLGDFVIYTGAGGAPRDLEIGQNIIVNGLVGSNGNIKMLAGSELREGLRAGGSLNPGGLASSGAEIGTSSYLANAIVNGDFNYRGDVFGNVHAGGDVLLGAPSDILQVNGVGGNVFAAGNLTYNANGVNVQGNVKVGGTVINPSNGVVGGTTTTGVVPAELLSYTIFAMPTASVFSAGGADVSDTAVLAPGSYDVLNIGSNKSITLASGDYFFTSFAAGGGLDLRLDLSSGGPINIYVVGNISIGSNMDVLIKGPGDAGFTDVDSASTSQLDLASKVYIETHGQFDINGGGDLFGTIYAAVDVAGDGNKEVNLGTNTQVWGAVYSIDQIDILSGSIFNYERSYLLPAPEQNPPVIIPSPAAALAGFGAFGLLAVARRRHA